MAKVRDGNSDVLVIVDTQVGILREAWDVPRIVDNIARLAERARGEGVPVVWVKHGGEEMPRGSAGWHWVPELTPPEGEPTVHKEFNSGFEDTELDALLAGLGTTRIVLAGAMTNWCIRATAYGALERGYDLALVKDGHTTGKIELPHGRVIEAADLIMDLNIGLNWIRYPGRTSKAIPAADITFNGVEIQS
jgi:nicotinamidase-related amidase